MKKSMGLDEISVLTDWYSPKLRVRVYLMKPLAFNTVVGGGFFGGGSGWVPGGFRSFKRFVWFGGEDWSRKRQWSFVVPRWLRWEMGFPVNRPLRTDVDLRGGKNDKGMCDTWAFFVRVGTRYWQYMSFFLLGCLFVGLWVWIPFCLDLCLGFPLKCFLDLVVFWALVLLINIREKKKRNN